MRSMNSTVLLKVTTAQFLCLSILALSLFFFNPAWGALYPANVFFPPPNSFFPPPSYRQGEILIKFKPGTPPAQIESLSQRYALRQVSSSPYSGLHRVLATSAGDLIPLLRQEPGVALVEANFIRRTEEFIPNDPLFGLQWHLNINGLPLAWDLSTGQNVTVALLDTGVAYENFLKFDMAPDLADTLFVPGWDFVNDDAHPDDDNRHGTHIAGVVAQSSNNLVGGAGVAFQCTLMPVKVLDSSGSGDVATIVNGIYYAVNNGAQIINMSYGSIADPSASEEEAIKYAVNHGVLVICSAGNEATDQPHYPSSYSSSISVTATRYDNQFASSYSNYGPDVDVAAPGGDLSLDQDGDGNPDGIYQQTHDGRNFRSFDFYYAEGTSSACAYVSGVAALILSRGRGKLSVSQAREILESTAIDMDTPGWDQYYGWGVVDPYTALLAVDATVGVPTDSPAVATSQGYLLPFPPLSPFMPFGPQAIYPSSFYAPNYGINNQAAAMASNSINPLSVSIAGQRGASSQNFLQANAVDSIYGDFTQSLLNPTTLLSVFNAFNPSGSYFSSSSNDYSSRTAASTQANNQIYSPALYLFVPWLL